MSSGAPSVPSCPVVCPPCETAATGGGGTCDLNGTPQLSDNGNGTVTDARTGLIWLKDANCGGGLNWANANTWAAGLAHGTCGLSDGSAAGAWRVPTRQELESVLDLTDGTVPIVDTTIFTNVQIAAYYWTSTEFAPNTAAAWYVILSHGLVNGDGKTATNYAWAVR